MTLTIELPAEQQAALATRALEHGVSAEEYVRQVLAHDLESSLKPRRPIWDVIAESMKNVPAEDLAALPKDGLSQIDHYVYGVPKRAL
jgi:plasmid stability protein